MNLIYRIEKFKIWKRKKLLDTNMFMPRMALVRRYPRLVLNVDSTLQGDCQLSIANDRAKHMHLESEPDSAQGTYKLIVVVFFTQCKPRNQFQIRAMEL